MEGWIQKYKDMRGFGLAQFGLLPERCGSEEEYQRRMLNLWTGTHKNMESPKPAIMETAGGVMGVVQKPGESHSDFHMRVHREFTRRMTPPPHKK